MKQRILVLFFSALCCCRYSDRPDTTWLSSLAFAAPWMMIATGTNCTGWYSVNGRTWQSFLFPGCTTGTISSIAYGAGAFVAVGSTNGTACGIWTSTGRYTPQWTLQSCGPTSARMSAVAFGSGFAGNEFVAAGVATGANFQSVSSMDAGVTWVDATITEAGSGAAVGSLVYWPTGQLFIESSGTPQNTRRRFIGGGTTWIDGDNLGVLNPKIATGPTLANGSVRVYDAGNSPTVIQYGDDAFVGAPTNLSPNVFGSALPIVNDMIYGEGKRMVFVRDTCGVTFTSSSSAGDASGSYTMSNCVSNLKAVGYLDPFFIAGTDDGSFYYSVSGLPSEWLRASSASSTSVVQRMAGRWGPFN